MPAGSKIIAQLDLRQLDAQPRQPGPDQDRHLGRADVGGDAGHLPALPLGRTRPSPHQTPEYEKALRANLMMGILDDNMDGKLAARPS